MAIGSRDMVLIIEDNEGIGGLLSVVLKKNGLRVIWKQTGREALDAFELHQNEIALVVSDCRLPDMDGREACRQMREHRPDLPLLLSSGSAAYLNTGPLTSGHLIRFMPKPYSPGEMMVRVRQLREEATKNLATISAGFV